MKKRAVIFDIDGTLSNLDHRLHFIKDGAHDWSSFFANCIADTLVHPVADMLRRYHDDPDITVLIATGRPSDYGPHTISWLAKNDIQYETLYMRNEDDYRNDAIIKREILHKIQENYEVVFTVDDRQRVVDMWRDEGILCMQVGPDFDKPSSLPLLPLVVDPLLVIMIGPSGAGKSRYVQETWDTDVVVSSDGIRQRLLGSQWHDPSYNRHVFSALHAIVKARLEHSLFTVVDATNLKRKDRLAVVALAPEGAKVQYVVVNRLMVDKKRDGGWRNELGFDLIDKHQKIFESQRRDIMAGDDLSHVTVKNLTNLGS